jgi:hypothetical protein
MHENKASGLGGGDNNKKKRSEALKDVTVFVDVRTGEGDDAGGVFTSLLRDLGARVCRNCSPSYSTFF